MNRQRAQRADRKVDTRISFPPKAEKRASAAVNTGITAFRSISTRERHAVERVFRNGRRRRLLPIFLPWYDGRAFSRMAGEYPVGIPALNKVEVEFENQSDPSPSDFGPRHVREKFSEGWRGSSGAKRGEGGRTSRRSGQFPVKI